MTANADALNQLSGDVQNESSVVDSAIVLINGLANRLTDILAQHSSPEDLTTQIQTLRDEINQRSVSLAQAIAAGTTAENDSSNFPTTPATPAASDTSSPSTETPSSDTSAASTTGSDSSSVDTGAVAGSDATPPPETSADAGQPVSPAGDGTADVADPSVADLPVTEDSPPAVETPGDTAVVPDAGTAVPDESTTTPTDTTPAP